MVNAVLAIAAVGLLVALLTALLGLLRHAAGDSKASSGDLMLAAQLLGTTGIGLLMLLNALGSVTGLLDVALVLALLAVVATIALTRRPSPDDAQEPRS